MELTAKQANDDIYAKLKDAERELRENRKKEIEEKTREIVRQAEAELAVHKSKNQKMVKKTEETVIKIEKENKSLQSQLSQIGNLKGQLEKVRKQVQGLQSENTKLTSQNRDISNKLRELRDGLKLGAGPEVNNRNYFESPELKQLKDENKRLVAKLKELDQARKISANVSTEVNVQSNKAERDRRVGNLIDRTKKAERRTAQFIDDNNREHNRIIADIDPKWLTEDIDDEAVAPDYSDEDDISYNMPSENYVKSTSKSYRI